MGLSSPTRQVNNLKPFTALFTINYRLIATEEDLITGMDSLNYKPLRKRYNLLIIYSHPPLDSSQRTACMRHPLLRNETPLFKIEMWGTQISVVGHPQ